MNKYSVILNVCKTGSFSKTAQLLNYSQSAISQTVKTFEEEIGFPIFKRTNSGVELLPAASDVIDSIKIIINEQEKLEQISQAMTISESGTVRLGVFFSFAVTYLPKIIKDFNLKYPKIKFEIFTGNQDEIRNKLLKGNIDIAFTSKASVLDFKFKEVICDELVGVLPLDHKLVTKPSLSIHDYNDLTYVLSGEKFDFEIGNIIKEAKVKPNHALEIYDEMVSLRLIEAGFGIGIFSKFFLDSIPNHANVAVRPFNEHYYRSLGFAVNEDHFFPASSRLFLEYIKNWFNI